MGKKLKVLLVILMVFMCPVMVNADEINDNPNEEVEILPLEIPKFSIKTGNGNNTISINNYVEGVAYHIYRSTNEKKGYKEITITTSSEYLDSTALIGTKYYYRVVATRGEETTKYYTANKTNTLASTKATAKVLSKSSVQLTWNEVVGADGYQVYRATSKNGKYKKVATTKELTFTNTKLTPGTKYYYKVRAYKAVNGKVGYSAYYTVTVTPNVAKAKYSVATYDYNKIKVSIEKVAGANGYQIYRATSKNGKYKLVKDTTSTSYVDSKLTTGKTYYYKVRAYAKVGKSKKAGAYNSVVSTKPQLKTPTFSVANNSKDPRKSLTIKINKVAGATGYVIYRKEGEAWKKVTTTKKTSYTNSKLILGTEYTYTVKAYRVVSKKNVYSGFNEVGITGKTTDENSDSRVKEKVEELLHSGIYSKQALINKLVDFGFDKTRANFAANTTYGEDEHKIDYKEQCLAQGTKYLEKNRKYTEKQVRDALKKKLYTTEDINYAINYLYYIKTIKVPQLDGKKIDLTDETPFDDATYNIYIKNDTLAEGFQVYYSETKDGYYQFLYEKSLVQYQNDGALEVKVPAGKHLYYKVRAFKVKNGERFYTDLSAAKDYNNELKQPKYTIAKEETNDYNKTVKVTLDVNPAGQGVELYYSETKDGTYTLYKDIKKYELESKYNSESGKYEFEVEVPLGKRYFFKGRNYAKYDEQVYYSNYSNVIEKNNLLITPSISLTADNNRNYNNKQGIYLVYKNMQTKNIDVYYSEQNSGPYVLYENYNVVDNNGEGSISLEVPAGKQYYFKIKTYSVVGEEKIESQFSNIVNYDNKFKNLNITLDEKAGSGTNKTATISITNLQGTKVEIYRSTEKNSGYSLLTTRTFGSSTESVEYTDTVPSGTHYYYKFKFISVVNGENIESDYSKIVDCNNAK